MSRKSRTAGTLLGLIAGGVLLSQETSWRTRTPNFWPIEQRDAGFRAMEKVYSTKPIPAGGKVHAFAEGKPLRLGSSVSEYMTSQRASGLLVVHKNAIRLEQYAMGYNAKGHWESFSVAKSITSTLVGAAIQDGYIQSLNDSVSKYITGLKDSAYRDVTIRQLLTMTSGVKWNENYEDPNSDAVRLRLHRAPSGVDVTVSYMSGLAREYPPGEKWAYKTGETELVGVLVRQATGKSLSGYLSEKIWKPYGMETAALWELNESGGEMGGCCLSASLRDYARFGQFVLDGGRANGKRVVPDDWLPQATHKQVDIGSSGHGYGYQWWTNDDGSFQAIGIYGQNIFIDPKRQLVVVMSADWPSALDSTRFAGRTQFLKQLVAYLDAEN